MKKTTKKTKVLTLLSGVQHPSRRVEFPSVNPQHCFDSSSFNLCHNRHSGERSWRVVERASVWPSTGTQTDCHFSVAILVSVPNSITGGFTLAPLYR